MKKTPAYIDKTEYLRHHFAKTAINHPTKRTLSVSKLVLVVGVALLGIILYLSQQ